MAIVTDIRQWLRKSPLPTTIKCTCPDGVLRTISVAGKEPGRFARATEAIEGMEAIKLEALDGKGHVIRNCDLKQDDPVETTPIARAATTAQQSDLAHFASLLARATDNGAKSVKETTDQAFKMMGDLMALVMKRLDAVEQQQIKQLNAAARAAAKAEAALAGAGGDDGELSIRDILLEFVSGMRSGGGGGSGAAPAAAAAPSNGANDA